MRGAQGDKLCFLAHIDENIERNTPWQFHSPVAIPDVNCAEIRAVATIQGRLKMPALIEGCFLCCSVAVALMNARFLGNPQKTALNG